MAHSVVRGVVALLVPFAVGLSLGWLARSRRPAADASRGIPRRGEDRTSRTDAPRPRTAPSPAPARAPDDLKRIRGVGPALERRLNGLGVTRFAQIAAWTEADVARIDDHLRFRGRIERDDWIGQARRLLGQPAD